MSKVWTTYNTRVAEGLEKSLKSLGLEYVDLFLIVSFFFFVPSSNGCGDGQCVNEILVALACSAQPQR